MTTVRDRRLAEAAAKLDTISPPPSEYDRLVAKNPWILWATVDELMALDDLFHETEAETIGDMSEADQARAAVIYYAIEARRLAGAPPEDEKNERGR